MKERGKKKDILEAAEKLYFKYSVSRVTVDDVAEYAGVSKKTIYNHFSSREMLEKEIFTEFLLRIKDKLAGIIADKNASFENRISALASTMTSFSKMLTRDIVVDLQKQRKGLWEYIDGERKRFFVI